MGLEPASIPITIRGRYLWRGEKRFFVRGVVYQVSDVLDPIADERLPELTHDIELFKELGLNTILVYSIDYDKDHEHAMKLLEDAGIYVLTTVSTPRRAINRLSPYESYEQGTITAFFKVVDAMANYSNTMGIFAASEIVNDEDSSSAVPVIKGTVRDLKKYMRLKSDIKNQRVIPIGYNAASTDPLDIKVLDHLARDDGENSIDFWTCCNYSWAGESSIRNSGYENMLKSLGHATIPIFFSEYGTKIDVPRIFQETKALYSPKMTRIISGGCAYEFWQGSNGYGLVAMEEPVKDVAEDQKSRKKKASKRDRDEERRNKVAERRETSKGILLIYEDFVNFKESLAAVSDNEADQGTTHGGTATTKGTKMSLSGKVAWGIEPDTCVDWDVIENAIRG